MITAQEVSLAMILTEPQLVSFPGGSPQFGILWTSQLLETILGRRNLSEYIYATHWFTPNPDEVLKSSNTYSSSAQNLVYSLTGDGWYSL